MKILGITTLYPTARRPDCAPFNRDQLGELARLAEIELCVPIRWTERFTLARTSREQVAIPVFSPTYFYPPGLWRGTHGKYYLQSIRRTVFEMHRRRKFDVLYGMFAYPDGWAAGRLAKELGLPFVLKIHGSDVHQLRNDPERAELLTESLRAANHVVAVSGQLARDATELVPGLTVSVIRNGVDQVLFSPGAKEEVRARLNLPLDRKIVLFIGRMEQVKGADLVSQIAAAMKTRAYWVLIGDGTLSSEVRSAIPAAQSRLILSVRHHETVHWIRAADAVLIPSRNEGIPNVLLESLAADRPVVATNVGGISEVIRSGPASKLESEGDVSGMARALDELLEAPPAVGAAREIVRSFTWPGSAKRLMSVFQESLE